jgi:hypothetical protein
MLSRTCASISRACSAPVTLEEAVGQRRLAVVDVRDDREVAEAATMAECRSVSVAAATRAANVDAFSSWSACRTSADVERAHLDGGRAAARQHVQEVGRVAERRVRIDGPPPAASGPRWPRGAHLRGQPTALR